MLPNIKNEQLLFVTLDFKPSKICYGCGKLLIGRSDFVTAMVVLLEAVRET
jgi:hypothetical protein